MAPTAKPQSKSPATDDGFETVAVPVSTRIPTANPYTEAVKVLDESRDSARAFTVPASADKEAHRLAVAKAHRLLSEAGAAQTVTVRKITEASGDAGPSRITFWVVDKISRPRGEKPAETATA